MFALKFLYILNLGGLRHGSFVQKHMPSSCVRPAASCVSSFVMVFTAVKFLR